MIPATKPISMIQSSPDMLSSFGADVTSRLPNQFSESRAMKEAPGQ
jgi:hypothetical protein